MPSGVTSVDATGLELGATLREFALTSSKKLNIQNMPSSLYGNQIIDDGPKLENLTFTGTSLEDFSFINDFVNLKNINISSNMIRSINIDGSKLTKLVGLNLNSNKIVSLRGIDKFKSLTTLDLSNNLITDRSAYLDDSGETVNYNNLSEIVKLHPNNGGHLLNLKISGNSGILDYAPLKAVTWNSIDV